MKRSSAQKKTIQINEGKQVESLVMEEENKSFHSRGSMLTWWCQNFLIQTMTTLKLLVNQLGEIASQVAFFLAAA